MEASNREASGQGAGGGAGTAVLQPPGEPRVERAEQEAEHSKLPHLWASRPWPLRIFLATVPPAVYGSLCGWVLGVSEVAYIILAIPLAILLQVVVGLEHRNRAEAAARGFVAGACFGGFILIVNQLLIDTEPKFHLQDPKWSWRSSPPCPARGCPGWARGCAASSSGAAHTWTCRGCRPARSWEWAPGSSWSGRCSCPGSGPARPIRTRSCTARAAGTPSTPSRRS